MCFYPEAEALDTSGVQHSPRPLGLKLEEGRMLMATLREWAAAAVAQDSPCQDRREQLILLGSPHLTVSLLQDSTPPCLMDGV